MTWRSKITSNTKPKIQTTRKRFLSCFNYFQALLFASEYTVIISVSTFLFCLKQRVHAYQCTFEWNSEPTSGQLNLVTMELITSLVHSLF